MTQYTKIDKKVDGIIKNVKGYMKNLSPDFIDVEIRKAYIFAKEAHEGQYRKSGDPYIIHPVEATKILLSLKPDIYTIQSCLLHDVIEDTPRTAEDIQEIFGDEVAFLCLGMEKLSKVRYKGEQREVGSLRKMFIAMAEDLRVVFIKLSDRLHNMRTLKFHPKPEKREKIALETINIFSPIADRLGLYNFKNELDQECLKILDIKNYKKIKKQLKEMEDSRESFLKNVRVEIKKILDGEVQDYEIDYRVKSIYSIHKKLTKKGIDHIEDLHDLFGIRVIVKDLSDCYRVLGLIHNKWSPLPYRFKDYIALPKPNGYKSIHTTVIGLLKEHRKQPTEIQIKTYKMKEYSDIGVAAHFEYKEKGSSIVKDIDWIKELKDLTQNIVDSDFIGSLKIDMFKNRIFVFTPKGDLINLPHGSTPVDFAYYVHTELGNHISMAKVNDKIYPLDKELHNGDFVDIIIDKNKIPSPFRISFLKTVKAKNSVKSYLKKEDKELHRERGKDIMNKYLDKLGLGVFDKDLSLLKVIDGKKYSTENRWTLLEEVGSFNITPSILLKRIIKSNKIDVKGSEAKALDSAKKKKNTHKRKVIIGGEANLKYTYCQCCKKQTLDAIVSHINSKGILTVHKRDCKILRDVNKERLLPTYVEGYESQSLEFSINFVLKNKIGMLKSLTEILFSMDINIEEIISKKIGNLNTGLSLKLVIPDYDYLIIDRLIDRVKLYYGDDLVSHSLEKIMH
ncbi:bifunctional (p)ppGpp synthetase/guanosine-3',5'-bis(diphosphate) 3'-pyrophosphohydrolase [Candidatus Gracilibacteria bacterium 28_42_T64]|nr:bifunctional (p)ppGpp synthetase/guanosine-3',5'-bis(diphosphate) 3'-pyrophosphohydrolase [Candidatus Gracilibacteria bacterium 28_42_T64]